MNPQPFTIGLYGGSFNPPHLAHVLVAAWALAEGSIDRLWAIPTGGHPFGKPLAPFEDRMEMCRRAFAPFGERAQVLDLEREERVHYTIETVRDLAERFPDYRWRWVMGSDTLAEADRWRAFDELARLAPPLVIPRQGHGEKAGELALPDVNSTDLRRWIAQERPQEAGRLMPRAVAEWIETRGLYRDAEDNA